jgi:hypothetical protein
MRHATWLKIDSSPFWHEVYRRYRYLPPGARQALRVLMSPRWYLAASLVKRAAHRRVVAGPFRGMRLELSPLSGRHLLGYILGSQELELRDAVASIAGRGYRTILNVGAADGYYAVGLALRLPQARVEAFEGLPEFHPLIARSAARNGVVDRLAIHGYCTTATLREQLGTATAPTLIVMDIEGGEVELLDLDANPLLAHADILVETHDAFIAHATETLVARFSATHEIDRYRAQPRTLDDFPADFLPLFRRLFPRLAVDLLDERRTGVQRWLFLTAKRAAGDPIGTAAAEGA